MRKIGLYITIVILFLSSLAMSAEQDLDSFLKLVEKNNKDLQLAKKELEMAGARKKEAYAFALPKIFAQGTYKRNFKEHYLYMDMGDDLPPELSFMSFDKMKINRNNEFGMSAVVDQTLFNFKVGTAIIAARQYADLTDYIFRTTRSNIIKFAKQGFYQALLLKKVWEVNVSAEKNAHDNYINMEKKYQNGVVSEFQLLQAKVRWQNMIPKVTESKRNYDLILLNLKNIAGIPTDSLFTPEGSLEQFPPLPQFPAFNEILFNRPDINALKMEKKLRSTNVKANFADYLPNLSGQLIFAYSSFSDEWKMENENKDIILGLTLNVPLWTGGYTGAQVQKAKIERDKTTIKISKTEESVYKEVENIKLRLREAYKRIEAADVTRHTAKKAFIIAQTAADNGLATQLELKDARTLADQAELGYYAAVLDYLMAYFDYEYAVGKL